MEPNNFRVAFKVQEFDLTGDQKIAKMTISAIVCNFWTALATDFYIFWAYFFSLSLFYHKIKKGFTLGEQQVKL